ncbi:hypothetical protein HA402_005504 [Bradysia odoriphaga]|nr:hypothetical protein HA402_005504 [Bradysia odoriphaga]
MLQRFIKYRGLDSNQLTNACTINLLLLGKSGVGKSSFINAFQNYMAYSDITDVRSLSDVKFSVPVAFEMCDSADNYHRFVIGKEQNTDENENLEGNAQSGTLKCKVHRCQFENITINFIDTPGLLDTAGVDKDKENMKAVLSCIARYKYIHGICIFLLPDEERLNDAFKYCILELLCQLDNVAASNIVWIFTKASASLYKVGSTHRALSQMIDSIYRSNPKLKIPFSKNNYFLFDSLSFKYLVAKEQITFIESEIQAFTDCWKRSRVESQRLIRHACNLEPYDVRASLYIYRTRELIGGLLPHLMEITKNIVDSDDEFQQKKDEVDKFQGNIEELKKILFIEHITLNTTYYDLPRYVCKSDSCRKETLVNGEILQSYPQVCFSADYLDFLSKMRGITDFPVHSLSVAGAVIAGAAVGLSWYVVGTCPVCGCGNIKHRVNFYEIHVVKKQVEDPVTKELIATASNDVTIKIRFLKFLEEQIEALQHEKEVITKANGIFAVFLKQRAIAPYSDAFPGYLKVLIASAEKSEGGAVKVARLKEYLNKYLQLIEAIGSGSLNDVVHENQCITTDLIDNMVEQLKNLPKYGSAIKTTIDATKNIHAKILNMQSNTNNFERFHLSLV